MSVGTYVTRFCQAHPIAGFVEQAMQYHNRRLALHLLLLLLLLLPGWPWAMVRRAFLESST